MITKGIVEDIIDEYFVRVRMPVYNGVTTAPSYVATEDLPQATICTLPSCKPNLQVGDVVFVGFEDNDFNKPIILGHLYGDFVKEFGADITLNSLTVQVNTQLSEDTSIGNVTPDNIKALQGAHDNLQAQIDILSDQSSGRTVSPMHMTVFTNISVASSDFVYDYTDTQYYVANVPLSGVTSQSIVQVVFSMHTFESGYVYPTCIPYDGGIKVFSRMSLDAVILYVYCYSF